jgi:hypothetical protein
VSTSASAAATLSSGAQLLLNDGFLPANLSTATLAQATPAELDAMANATIQEANVDSLFGIDNTTNPLFSSVSTASGDSVILSDEAAALLGQTPTALTTSASSTESPSEVLSLL